MLLAPKRVHARSAIRHPHTVEISCTYPYQNASVTTVHVPGLHGASVVIMGRREKFLAEAVRQLQNDGVEASYIAGDVRCADVQIAGTAVSLDCTLFPRDGVDVAFTATLATTKLLPALTQLPM